MSAHERAEGRSRPREREEDYQAIFELAGLGEAQVEPDNARFTRVNPRMCEITGYSEEELLGITFSEITHPDDREGDLEGFRRLVRGKQPVHEVEKRYVRKDGSVVWVKVNATLVRDEAGRPLRTVAIIQDVTEHRRAQEKLRESEERFRGLAEGVNFIPWEADPTTWRFTYVGPQAVQILGYPLEAWYEGDFWAEHIHPEDRQWTIDYCAEASASCQQYRFEYRMLAADGRTVWLDDIVHVVEDQDGRQRLRGVMIDITERKQAEETRFRLAAIVESSDDAVIGKTLEGIITSWNKGAEKIYGYSAKEVVGKPISILAPPDRPDEIPKILEKIRRGEAIEHYETMRIAKDGRHLYVTLTISPVRDSAGNIMGASTIARDITERKRTEEEMREVREAERNRIARDLHDGPLQDLSYALVEAQVVQEISDDPELDHRLGRAVEALTRAGRELRGTVYDLRLGEKRDRPFAELLESVVELNRRMLPGGDVRLEVEEGFPSSPLGERDSELLRILQEALTNARRHSEARRISASLGIEGDKIWAEVEDDGRGFGMGAAPGVGLRSMHERARALGGHLKVQSEPGKGTRVRFEMLLESEDGEEESGSEGETRVLLVEDHVSFREAAASIFEREPEFEVVGQAGSLAEARKMLEDETTADVSIIDLGLPDGYGGELIKELREANPQAQALVLSASFDRAEIARAVESGAAGVLHKSVGINEVVEAVRRLRAGQTLMPLEEVVELLRFAGVQREQEHEARRAIAQLTPREKEVLRALAQGLDGREIAERLNISVETERNHVTRILSKLGVHSRLQAVVFAVRHGLAEIPRQTGEG